MRIKGAELLQFIIEGWPGEYYYWDHDLFEEEKDGLPLPGKLYDTDDLGPLLWQGKDKDPTNGAGLNLDSTIRAWRKLRDSRVLVIRVPNQVSDTEILKALKSLKGKIEK